MGTCAALQQSGPRRETCRSGNGFKQRVLQMPIPALLELPCTWSKPTAQDCCRVYLGMKEFITPIAIFIDILCPVPCSVEFGVDPNDESTDMDNGGKFTLREQPIHPRQTFARQHAFGHVAVPLQKRVYRLRARLPCASCACFELPTSSKRDSPPPFPSLSPPVPSGVLSVSRGASEPQYVPPHSAVSSMSLSSSSKSSTYST